MPHTSRRVALPVSQSAGFLPLKVCVTQCRLANLPTCRKNTPSPKSHRIFTILRVLTLIPNNTQYLYYQTTHSHFSTKLHTVTSAKLQAAFLPNYTQSFLPNYRQLFYQTARSHSDQTTRSHSCKQHCALSYPARLNSIVCSESSSTCMPPFGAQRSALLSDNPLLQRTILWS
jgi:hypothetical protein